MKSLCIERIKQVYPDLKIDKVEENEIGQNNIVLVVNAAIVFRFPKYKKGIDQLVKEVKILKLLKKHHRLSIPYPTYQSFDELKVGKVFSGYEHIHGEPLWKDKLKDIENDLHLKILSFEIVNFLLWLHAASEKVVHRVLPDESVDVSGEYTALFGRIETKLFPFMRNDAKEEISRLFADFFNNIRDYEFKPTLIHGDFGASNILWDPTEMRITGIIDFGGSGLGDPAYDFAGILASYGDDFFERCISGYTDTDGKGLTERARFYQKTFALQEALHGLENNDEEAFRDGMEKYV